MLFSTRQNLVMPEPGNSVAGGDFNLIRVGTVLVALICLLGLSSLGNQAHAATGFAPAAYQSVYSNHSAPANTGLGRNNQRTSHEKGHLQPAFGAPTRLIAVSGSNQQITISHTFTEPLVAKVTDVINTPVSGEVVTFTIASATNGASATFAGG